MKDYASLVFDCDGVVLNSNAVKTMAFRSAVMDYGPDKADALVEHHVSNGGVSRYRKFDHFLRNIVGTEVTHDALESLLSKYAASVREGLLACELAPGLQHLRQMTIGTPWMLVSGGDQAELRDVFAARGINEWFDAGIFGSPDTKEFILAREIRVGNLHKPALFFGDSRYDHIAATTAGLDFAFISGWSEFDDWMRYFSGSTQPHFVFASINEAVSAFGRSRLSSHGHAGQNRY